MHLAILMTNTDESSFAERHPRDGVKFTDLIQMVRPDWTTTVFAVKDGVFPDEADPFDGVMITGSPASVLSGADWTVRLLQLIRDLRDRGVPLFGACFGHQAIALALAGEIGRNPGGWIHGLTKNHITRRASWMADLPDPLQLYGSHVEQVLRAPEDLSVITGADGCPITGMAGDRIYTTQHHPEMTPHFIASLTYEMAEALGEAHTTSALQSLHEPAHQIAFAESLARFFETAATKN